MMLQMAFSRSTMSPCTRRGTLRSSRLQRLTGHAEACTWAQRCAFTDHHAVSPALMAMDPSTQFSNLDESLQAEFEGFLEERGIDSGLALFCVDLVEYKEQREYMRWLDQVKSFVEA